MKRKFGPNKSSPLLGIFSEPPEAEEGSKRSKLESKDAFHDRPIGWFQLSLIAELNQKVFANLSPQNINDLIKKALDYCEDQRQQKKEGFTHFDKSLFIDEISC